jgi:hypothetical protein
MSSFGEDDEEDHPMPVFIPVMKCEVKVNYVLNAWPFCEILILGSFTKIYQHFRCLLKSDNKNRHFTCGIYMYMGVCVEVLSGESPDYG